MISDEESAIELELQKKLKKAEKKILTEAERKAGYTILQPYLSEKFTPVPENAFVRRGYIIQRAMDMSTKHNHIQNRLVNIIIRHLAIHGIEDAESRIFIGNRVNFGKSPAAMKRDELMPDIAVYEEDIPGDLGVIPHGKIPILVIEILSESTDVIDLHEKKAKYRKRGVKYYWLIAKADDVRDGLENSKFFVLSGNGYRDITPEVQESGILKCPLIFDLQILASDVWYSSGKNHPAAKWAAAEKAAEQEKQRAEQEKQLKIELTRKWKRYAELLARSSELNESERIELDALKIELEKEEQ